MKTETVLDAIEMVGTRWRYLPRLCCYSVERNKFVALGRGECPPDIGAVPSLGRVTGILDSAFIAPGNSC